LQLQHQKNVSYPIFLQGPTGRLRFFGCSPDRPQMVTSGKGVSWHTEAAICGGIRESESILGQQETPEPELRVGKFGLTKFTVLASKEEGAMVG
jgi:hypothetical protein